MSDGNYLFSNCIVDGDVTVLDVAPNTVLRRPWSFRVNSPPRLLTEMESRPNPGSIDPRRAARGYDGRIYDADTGEFLAHVASFSMRVTQTNEDLPLSGESWTPAINMNRTGMITMEETLVTDSLLKRFFDGIDTKNPEPVFAFRGTIRGR